MAVTFISRMTLKPGTSGKFVELCKALEKDVQANEPDCLYFKFFKLREPNRYAVIESFTSEAAEDVHLNAPYFKARVDGILGCLDGEYVREYLDDFTPQK